MEIKIDLKIFIFAIIFIITRQIKIFAFIMIFAFIHEIGHLITGMLLGLSPESIEIAPYGFSVKFKTQCNDYNKKIKMASLLSIKKIIIALAGPATNFIIIILVCIYYYVTKNLFIFSIKVDMIIYANMLITIFNLIPIYPLDGGRITKEWIHINYGIKKAYFYNNKISNVSIIFLTIFGSFGILIYKNIAIFIVIVYLWFLVIKENKRYKLIYNLMISKQKSIDKINEQC